MKKGLLAIVATASVSFAASTAQQSCENAVANLVSNQIPSQLQVKAHIDKTLLGGGKDLGNGWRAYVMGLSIFQNGTKISSDSLIAFCNDEEGLATTELASYDGKNYRAQIQKKIIGQLLEKYKDRMVVKGNSGRTLVLFTDPLCPYCQKFTADVVSAAMKRGDTLYVFGVALPMHPDSPEYEKYIDYGLANAKERDKGKIFIDLYNAFKGKHEASQIDKQKIEEIYRKYGIKIPASIPDSDERLRENRKVMALVGARGTPMVFDSGGKNVDIVEYIENTKFQALPMVKESNATETNKTEAIQ